MYRLGAWILLLMTAGSSQTSPVTQIPSIDVVSVRQHTTLSDEGSIGVRADGIYALNVPLQFVLNTLYKGEIPAEQMVGLPQWVATDHWDIVGKIAPEDLPKLQHLTTEQHVAMRAALLEQVLRMRFAFAAHRQQVEGPVYVLVPVKSGVRVKQAPDDTKPMNTPWNDPLSAGASFAVPGQVAGHDVPAQRLVNALGNVGGLGRAVVDRSGLTGNIDYALQWSAGPEAKPDNGSAAEALPSLFTAIQEQLGLRLEPARGLVTRLVVDHMERPTAN